MRAPIGRVEEGEYRHRRQPETEAWESLAFQGRVEEEDLSQEDEECPGRVRVCCPGSQRRSVFSRRAWAVN